MEKRKWIGLRIAVYGSLFINLYFLVRMLSLALPYLDAGWNVWHIPSLYFRLFVVFFIFACFQLMNARLLRLYSLQIEYPRWTFIRLHDFLMIMHTVFLVYYAYVNFSLYLEIFPYWKEHSRQVTISLIIGNAIWMTGLAGNLVTIIGSLQLRTYFKQQMAVFGKNVLDSIGNNALPEES